MISISLSNAITAIANLGGAVLSAFTIDRTGTRIDSTLQTIDKTLI